MAKVQFLSPEYLAEYHKLLSGVGLPEDLTVKIQYVVTDTPRGDVSYYFRIDRGTVVEVRHGTVDDPTVTAHLAYETTYRVLHGTLEPSDALRGGGLTFDGDPQKVAQLQRILQNEGTSMLTKLGEITEFEAQ